MPRLQVEGVLRYTAAKAARLDDKSQGSLIAIERNAFTYAGFTVWNQRRKHKVTTEGGKRKVSMVGVRVLNG